MDQRLFHYKVPASRPATGQYFQGYKTGHLFCLIFILVFRIGIFIFPFSLGKFCIQLFKRVWNVFEKNQPHNNVFVFWGIYVLTQFICCQPESFFKGLIVYFLIYHCVLFSKFPTFQQTMNFCRHDRPPGNGNARCFYSRKTFYINPNVLFHKCFVLPDSAAVMNNRIGQKNLPGLQRR